MTTIKVKDFSEFPGPRFKRLGPFSGEEFRDSILIPAIIKGGKITVDLDGTYGYGSSFLEEAFGGLVRAEIKSEEIIYIRNNLKCTTDLSYVIEVQEYIDDALKEASS